MARTPPNRKFFRNERMSAEDLLYYLDTEAKHLVMVLDYEYPVENKRPYLWVVKRAALDDQPGRFVPVTDAQALDAELAARRLFVSLSPGGWIQFRRLPEDFA